MPDKAKDEPEKVVAPATDPKPSKKARLPYPDGPLPDDAPKGAVGRMGADGIWVDKDGAEVKADPPKKGD